MRSELEGLRVFIVEDEFIVAMLIEDLLVDLGCTVAGIASRLDEALSSVFSLKFDVAIVDANLNGVQSGPVAEALRKSGIPFVMATGYGAQRILEAFPSVPVLGKPFQQDHLEKALRAALDAGQDPGRAERTSPQGGKPARN